MDVGIMTMQNVDNIGSLLQAYGLKKYISQFGEVYFIPLEKAAGDHAVPVDIIDYGTSEQEGKLSKLSKIDKYFFFRLKNKWRVKKQRRMFAEFRKQHFKQIKEKDHYDLCVIGSDEVFNCLEKSPWGFTSRLFGNVQEADCVVSYAASCGFTTYEKCSEQAKKVINSSLKKMAAISVRDKNTFDFVNKNGIEAQDIRINLDPVCVFDYSKEMEQNDIELPDNACIIYSYHNRIKNQNEIAQIKAFCKKNDLRPVAVGDSQVWLSDMLCLNPFETLTAFRKAKFVITDTFHGTIMAAKYNGHFATMIRGSNSNKLSDLVQRIGVQSHVVDSWEKLQDVYTLPSCMEAVSEKIKQEHEKTVAFFHPFLSGSEKKDDKDGL